MIDERWWYSSPTSSSDKMAAKISKFIPKRAAAAEKAAMEIAMANLTDGHGDQGQPGVVFNSVPFAAAEVYDNWSSYFPPCCSVLHLGPGAVKHVRHGIRA